MTSETENETSGHGEQPAPAEPNQWESRYRGLQRVIDARHAENLQLQDQLEQLRAAQQADADELAEYRTQKAAAEAEAAERATWETLNAKYATPRPTPVISNPPDSEGPADWYDRPQKDDRWHAEREHGYPTG